MNKMSGKLFLNKKIYEKNCLSKAIAAYRNIAEITFVEDSLYWICDFQNCKYGEERTVLEFENYLIELSNHTRQSL